MSNIGIQFPAKLGDFLILAVNFSLKRADLFTEELLQFGSFSLLELTLFDVLCIHPVEQPSHSTTKSGYPSNKQRDQVFEGFHFHWYFLSH